MKHLFGFILLAFPLTYLSCEKKNEDQNFPFVAEVQGINMDCGIHQIKFLNDLDKVIELCGRSVVDGVYIAGNLPDSLKTEGVKIELNIGKQSSNQLGACTMMRPTLAWVWIINARPK
jgi:hypothetical protein